MGTSRTIILNGESRDVEEATIGALAEKLGLNPVKIAVEQNGAIVPRATLTDTPLCDGDILEIVHFVGGG